MHIFHWFISGDNFFEILFNFSCLQLSFKPSRALVFIKIKWRSIPSCVHLCLRIYTCKRIKFSKFVQHDCALQYFWALLDTCETCGRCLFSFTDGTAHFKDIKVCIKGFSQFLYVPNEVRLLAFFWMKKAISISRYSWTWTVATWKAIVSTASSRWRRRDDRRNGNCGFPTLRNVNQEI